MSREDLQQIPERNRRAAREDAEAHEGGGEAEEQEIGEHDPSFHDDPPSSLCR